MTELKINIKCDDGELERAIKFLHNNESDIENIKAHYFKDGVLDIDMSVIKDEHQRYYHVYS